MRADDVEIGRPCPIDLRERIADASAEFHCDHCDRPVHVLSHMSEEAAAQVLARRQRDNLCVALLRAGDGRVHFREKGEHLIPASRLGGPRTMLRASALALTMAACSGSDEGPVEVSNRDLVEQPDLSPPTVTVPSNPTQANDHAHEPHDPDQAEQYEVLAGAPPLLDEEEDQPRGPNDERFVAFGALEPISTPDVPRRKLLATRRARKGGRELIELRFCVDERGRVRDVERISGDKQLASLYATRVTGWRFEPYAVNGKKTPVCTTRHFFVLLDDESPA